MRDNVGLPETTPPFAIEFPLSDPLRASMNVIYRASQNHWRLRVARPLR